MRTFTLRPACACATATDCVETARAKAIMIARAKTILNFIRDKLRPSSRGLKPVNGKPAERGSIYIPGVAVRELQGVIPEHWPSRMYSRQMADASRQRERVLLETVARSEGAWSTRDIDFEVSRQTAPGALTVPDELKILESAGFIERVQRTEDASFVGWCIT